MALNIRTIITGASTFAGGALAWLTRRSGKGLTTTLAVPGATFLLNALNDIVKKKEDQGSIGVAEAALSLTGSAYLGYMTGNGTDVFFNSAAFLGTYALLRSAVVEKSAATTRNRVRV